jgi:hypothetical protein
MGGISMIVTAWNRSPAHLPDGQRDLPRRATAGHRLELRDRRPLLPIPQFKPMPFLTDRVGRRASAPDFDFRR